MGRRDLADLARLADGSLPPARRAAVQERLDALPGGRELLENERRAVEALRSVADEQAPVGLRERVAADRARAGRAPGRRRAVLGGGLAGALAVIALALVLVLPGGTPGAPSVSAAATLAVRGPSSPAPPVARGGSKLARDVDEVYFPNWKGSGYTAYGERVARLDGHLLDTVYYTSSRGQRIAYTIVGGSALPQPGRAALSRWGQVELRSLDLGRRIVVTWRRDGRTCILTAARNLHTELLRLAGQES
jgi:anti-sigma factor RsiW